MRPTYSAVCFCRNRIPLLPQQILLSELKNEVKSEIIMLLGAALGAGTVRASEGAAGRGSVDSAAVKAAGGAKEPDDPTMMELADGWG